MAAAKKTDKFTPKESDYQLPGNGEWSENNCPGSIGSFPNLVDIELQHTENNSAMRENRKPNAIAVHCGFCQGYHLDMQPPPDIVIQNNRQANYFPPPVVEPEADQDLVDKGSYAVSGNFKEESGDDDNSGSDSDKSSSDS